MNTWVGTERFQLHSRETLNQFSHLCGLWLKNTVYLKYQLSKTGLDQLLESDKNAIYIQGTQGNLHVVITMCYGYMIVCLLIQQWTKSPIYQVGTPVVWIVWLGNNYTTI